MQHWNKTQRILLVGIAACLLCCPAALAEKGGNGGGGRKGANYTIIPFLPPDFARQLSLTLLVGITRPIIVSSM